MPLPAERLSSLSFWGMSSPLLRALWSLAGRASIAPLTIEGYLWACRSCWAGSSLSFWGMSSPLSRAHGWACRSLLSGGVPSHSEEWVLHSPELVIGLTLRSEFSALELLIGSWVPLIPRNEFSALQGSPSVELALLPFNRRVTYEHAAPFWASEFLRPPELCDRSLALLVEPALLPSTRGSSMSLPLPSERLSSLSLRGMSSSPLQGIERSSNKCTRETLGTF